MGCRGRRVDRPGSGCADHRRSGDAAAGRRTGSCAGPCRCAARPLGHAVIITGHRGALGSEPENTLRSFRRAVADGCDEIELDLRVSADGELVIMHDATVDRTTSGSGEVAGLTLDKLRSLDAGFGEQIPTWS